MGRKSRFDGQSQAHHHLQHGPSALTNSPARPHSNSRSPSPTPDRRKDDRSVYARGPGDRPYGRHRGESPPADRERHYPSSSSRAGYEMHSGASGHVRDDSPDRQDRIGQSRGREEEHRAAERYSSPERIQKPLVSMSSSSPTHTHHDGKRKKYKQNKSWFDNNTQSRGHEKDKYKSPSHRQRDVYKPLRNGDGSRPSSSGGRARDTTSINRSTSPRPERASQSSSGRDYYASAPSSESHHHEWRETTQAPVGPRSPALSYRIPLEERDCYAKFPSAEYDKLPPPHSPPKPSSQRRYEEYPTHPKNYERRDSEQPDRERPKRQRGGDYDREEWERTHRSQEIYISKADIPYHSEHPDKSRASYDAYEKYSVQTNSRYSEPQAYPDELQPRRTPQGPRSQYEDTYRDRYPYEPRRAPIDRQQSYPPPEDFPEVRSSQQPRHSHESSRYEEDYPERYPPPPPPEEIQSPEPPAPAPQPSAPTGRRHQPGFRPIDNRSQQPAPSAPPASVPTGPKLESGIKPFTLKGNVLKNLKRTRNQQDLDSERIFKSSRVSPRHVTAPTPTIVQMPPPPPAPAVAEVVQQTQTPETPSNRERLLAEGRVPMKEKGTSVFERIGQVGEGTYGKVYKARNTLTGEFVALKKIRMESEREGFPITAMREIKLLESLRHPNIIHLQEMMCEKANVYMIFEYMDHDLAGILSHPNFTFKPSHIKDLLRQMLEGLHYLHHRGILHRDIKGSNILLDGTGTLKLADFGLARTYHKRRPNLDYSNRVITLWYRPPELLLGATAYGPAVDIWSIGCIMLEMVARKAVFPGKDEIDQILKIWKVMGSPKVETWPKVNTLPWWELVKPSAENPCRFFEEFSGLLSEQGLDLAAKLLALDPERRPTAAEALQHAYFTKEAPKPERPTWLVNMDGEWHEFESKQRKRAQRESQQPQPTNAVSRRTSNTDNPQ